MAQSKFRKAEIKTIEACLRASSESQFFPDWEFELLFGISRSELCLVLEAWPDVDIHDDVVEAAIVGSLNNLLGYPHGHWDILKTYGIAGHEEVLAALDYIKVSLREE
jgi:hypothetical protein